MNFVYECFACTSANEEEVVFSRNSGEIRLENNRDLCKLYTPMKKYSFYLLDSETSVNAFVVKSFILDKFNNFTIVLRNSNAQDTLEIKMPLDSYKNTDMEKFSIGKKYNLKIE